MAGRRDSPRTCIGYAFIDVSERLPRVHGLVVRERAIEADVVRPAVESTARVADCPDCGAPPGRVRGLDLCTVSGVPCWPLEEPEGPIAPGGRLSGVPPRPGRGAARRR